MSSPPRTRSASKHEDIDDLSQKFEELKLGIISELKSEISTEINKLISSQQELINKLSFSVVQHESTIAVLQNSVEQLKKENESLKSSATKFGNEINKINQYSRRQSLRIQGIEIQKENEREEPETLVNMVQKMMLDVGMDDAPIHIIDRAHRIGPVYERFGDKKKCQTVLVKFTNFSYRTRFYRKRSKLDKKYKVRIDLTKENYGLFKEAITIINSKSLSKKVNDVYVFVDINCRIKIVDTSREEEQFVESIDDVKNFLAY